MMHRDLSCRRITMVKISWQILCHCIVLNLWDLVQARLGSPLRGDASPSGGAKLRYFT